MTTSTLDLLPGTEVPLGGCAGKSYPARVSVLRPSFGCAGWRTRSWARTGCPPPIRDIEPIRHDLRPERAAPLVNWLVYHQAFLLEQALGPDALLAVQPGRLRIEPYQLVPVLRAIRMVRVRLLLCDGVGLGKTCQTGLVLTELTARRLVHRILIVSPAGPLLEQWKVEMSERLASAWK